MSGAAGGGLHFMWTKQERLHVRRPCCDDEARWSTWVGKGLGWENGLAG